MKEIKIIIPNCECMTDEQYKDMIEILESLPVKYEVWKKEDEDLYVL